MNPIFEIKRMIKEGKTLLEIFDVLLRYAYSIQSPLRISWLSSWNDSFRTICFRDECYWRLKSRPKLESKPCFHFMTKKDMKEKEFAYCIYETEDGVKLRRHMIGHCPDSEYKKEYY
jgi:hypothetical protein